ncbi:MraY family glycosyltransferase [Mucilaginibacter aquaedulcis]|uniref:MraY family glycosyltransferase n=1 Tax=Mucilaginibacter aquaedulcis TaxID=1187081 RepID=UPI0025B59D73|nr:glycosyltransferase family 4 protein [Mucilaginibacter aquaedulcis]MDN3547632.1 glycosyltransferase family 4 protein [Mucilaginibacter aquaedulcis]
MGFLTLLTFFFIAFAIELVYFRIALKYKIIDHPNHRSSHSKITIRGGGIIFCLLLLLSPFYLGWGYSYFLSGLFLICLISFTDDIKPISNRIRIVFHLTAVALLFSQLGIYHLPFYWILLAFVFVIGIINAINFMDGINGITGGFGLVTLVTLYYINSNIISFTDRGLLTLPILAVLVFNFFNFRKKAKCFAGDVGSVGLGFIVLFFLLQLIIKTNNLNYLLLLLVYVLDTSTTILFRIIRKENIFKAHRSHFYQFWANEKKIPHLVVAGGYAILQAIVNLIVINISAQSIVNLLLTTGVTIVVFILIRLMIEGSTRIFNVKTQNV